MASPFKTIRVPPFETWHDEHRATYATALHNILKGQVPRDVLARIVDTVIHGRTAQIVNTVDHWFTVDETMRADPLPGSDFVPSDRTIVRSKHAT